jgi:hypothetical protein
MIILVLVTCNLRSATSSLMASRLITLTQSRLVLCLMPPVLQNNFGAYVTLCQDFIKHQTTKSKMTPTVSISKLKTSTGTTKRKLNEIEDHHYTKAEYATLSASEKKELAS